MRISDWSSDVCSSDLPNLLVHKGVSRGRWAWSPSMFDVAETTPLDNLVAVQLAAKKLCNRKLPGAAMGAISKLLSAGRPVAKQIGREPCRGRRGQYV